MFNGIDFTQKEFLWLLLVLPCLVFWYVLKHKKQTAQLSISSVKGFQKNTIWSTLKHSLFVFRLAEIILVILALARPQTVDVSSKTKTTRGIDIVMAIDVSASMLAKDLKPNRLEALKNVAADFIKGRPNDRPTHSAAGQPDGLGRMRHLPGRRRCRTVQGLHPGDVVPEVHF